MGAVCSVAGCTNAKRARGFCVKHYAKWRKYRSPTYSMTKEFVRSRLRDGHAKYRSPLTLLAPKKDTRKGQRGSLVTKLVSRIKCDAIKVGHIWELSQLDTYKLISSACVYCGHNPWPAGRNGIDRVDSTGEYTKNNCVSACAMCNRAKNDKTLAEFFEWAERFWKYQQAKK